MPRRPLTLRELKKRLKDYGIVVMVKRGKGSEVILLRPSKEGSTQGPQYPMKNHGDGREISIPAILGALRRFHIDPDEFWE